MIPAKTIEQCFIGLLFCFIILYQVILAFEFSFKDLVFLWYLLLYIYFFIRSILVKLSFLVQSVSTLTRNFGTTFYIQSSIRFISLHPRLITWRLYLNFNPTPFSVVQKSTTLCHLAALVNHGRYFWRWNIPVLDLTNLKAFAGQLFKRLSENIKNASLDFEK